MSNNPTHTFENDRITDGFDIFFWEFHDKSGYASTHWHKAIEIMYIMEGQVNVVINNQTITLLSGDIFLIDSMVPHSTMTNGNHAVLIQLPHTMLEKYIPNIDSLSFSFDCHTTDPILQTKILQFIDVIKQMLIIFNVQPDGGILRFNSLVFELLFQLYHNFSHVIPENISKKKQQSFKRIDVILKYTNEHYREPITLSEIAVIACFEESYFCHFFKKNMGITYFQYLNELRLSHIRRDLVTTDLPLKTLLETHGFTNYKLFRKMFFEEFQCTPIEYRKLYTDIAPKNT